MELQTLSPLWAQAVETAGQTRKLGPADLALLRLSTPLGQIEDNILVAVPSDYAKSALEGEPTTVLNRILSEVLGKNVQIVLTVQKEDSEAAEETATPSENIEVVEEKPTPAPQITPPETTSTTAASPQMDSNLNSKYTFETFVTGSSNRFAHAAATAVAESPAKAYNPLFIYGGSGLGKTHLLHAIGHYAMSLYPNIRVRYTNSEEFTNDFINSIQGGRAEEFKRRYREVDILLVDDIQFLQGKEQTIEEFFHTFNTLHNAEKQVVITSDVPPKNLRGFEERMRSRFEWGLLTDVQPPDVETRIAILQKKALRDGTELPDAVLEYIASRFATNIRELEGAMVRVTAFASLNKQPMTVPLAEMVLKDIISDPGDSEITAALIKAQTANYFDITIEMLDSAQRSREISEARQIAMYLCRELTNLSLPKIGDAFGGRDHTTVMHANRKITAAMTTDPAIFNHVTELTNRIRQAARRNQ